MKEAIAREANDVAKMVIRTFVEITGYSPELLFRHSVGLFLQDQIVAGFELPTDVDSSAKLAKEAEDFLSTIECDAVRRAVLLLGAADFEAWRTMNFLEEGEDFAVVCFSSALHHAGAAWEVLNGAELPSKAKSTFGRIGANARHAENRAIKQEVFDWLDANPPRVMDSAATVISQTRAPITWRTARDWVSEWKKLRSTGTP